MQKVTNLDRYHIIQKPVLNLRDIMTLCGVGYKRAKQIQELVEERIAPNRIVNGLIPTGRVIEVMGIDVGLIIKLATS
jgi:hypothetical protein